MVNKKRLIDANALIEETNAEGAYGYVDAKQIADAPTVDVVPLVRCRECKFRSSWMMNRNLRYICHESGLFPNGENDFCSYGELKEGVD